MTIRTSAIRKLTISIIVTFYASTVFAQTVRRALVAFHPMLSSAPIRAMTFRSSSLSCGRNCAVDGGGICQRYAGPAGQRRQAF